MGLARSARWQQLFHPWGWLLLLLATLTLFPEIDLTASAAFYVPAEGFPWRESLVGEIVRHWVPRVIVGSAGVCAIAWIAGLVRQRAFAGLTTRRMAYLVTTLILGPGLVVETLLKPHWDRPRPEAITAFGGAAHYVPPLTIGEGCTSNCSFVSGHAAIAFWVTAYAFLLPEPYRRGGIACGLVFGALVGMVRVMQGAHFLSDVIYAGEIVVGINALVFHLMFRERAAPEFGS